VVIAIIIILVSLLLPALAKAKEAGKRILCSGNLKQWGTICANFSTDNNDLPPQTFRTHNTLSSGAGFPSRLNGRDSEADNDQWKTFGTPWTVWQTYGLTLPLCQCPSMKSVTARVITLADYNDPIWSPFVDITYSYVGGLSALASPNELGTMNWTTIGALVPVKSFRDSRTDRRLLAADWVLRYGPNAGDYYFINHPTRSGYSVEFQNHLFADGHVQGRANEAFLCPLKGGGSSLSAYNYAFRHFASGDYFWFYWGQDN